MPKRDKRFTGRGQGYRRCSLESKLFSGVRPEGDRNCWVWTRCTTTGGYGKTKHLGKQLQVHRAMWELVFGDPGELCVLHKCDNRPCCNPFHLFLGTRGDNNRDCAKKGRRPYGENNHLSFLLEFQVREILKLRAQGKLIRELASQFKMSETGIAHILKGRTWAHLNKQV